MLNKICHIIATVGFAGYFPIAPGTVGTLIAGLMVALFQPTDISLVIITPAVLILGTMASGNTEKILGKDSGHIVIDEFCGYLISVIFVPKSIGYLAAAFILFRLLDILKPPPIRNAEEFFSGGAGVMMDDVLAGVYTNICLQVWIYLMQ